ncbi:hypothetical protein J4208_04205 [Candidatus Woesearchaeota archaeon]|nr:hypothetical protein [Candidatus Woesearchaeota archaeon]
MQVTIQRWLERGIRTPRTAAYRGISIEELLLDIEAGGFMGTMGRLPRQGTQTCIPVYLSPLNLARQVPLIYSSQKRAFYQKILDDTTIADLFGDNDQEIANAQDAAQHHAFAVYLNHHGFYPVDEVADFTTLLSKPSIEPLEAYLDFATRCKIPLEKAQTFWKNAIGRKGLVIAFHEQILEKQVFDCCYPDCLNIMLPTGQTLPFSYVDGIEIPNPAEREELLASC